MKPLVIQGTDDTPNVKLDPASGVFEFVGNSYPENSSKFYQPILAWFQELLDNGYTNTLIFSFNFDYFNTSSAKYILEILRKVEEFNLKGSKCSVKWFYFEDDIDMREAGEDYQATIPVPFEIIVRQDTL